jgi:hypothetical protein
LVEREPRGIDEEITVADVADHFERGGPQYPGGSIVVGLAKEVPVVEREVGSSLGGQFDAASVLEASDSGIDNVLGGGGTGGGEGVDTGGRGGGAA